MAVREPGLERSARRFDAWGVRVLAVGVGLGVVGGLIYLLGRATEDWVKALGGMVAYVALAVAVVGLVLLCVAAVSHWTSRHKPYA